MSATQCPIRPSTTSTVDISECPIKSASGTLNPQNNMPYLPQTPLPGQSRLLPTDRETSSIPRSSNSSYGTSPKSNEESKVPTWVYPSPQQFYNALVRKGWKTPEEHVEAMVLIHNKLNEDAWTDLLRWEARYGGGPEEAAKLELAQFAGIHGHISHKAWVYQQLRRFFPTYFTFLPPFDRHDWIVRRPKSNKKLRYVIDYYSSRKAPFGEPQFHLDVRPAMDSIGAVLMRLHALLDNNLPPKFMTMASQQLLWYGCIILPVLGIMLGVIPRIHV